MSVFTETKPDAETHWRSIILFGRNVASYKFALGKTLIEFGAREQELVRLEELAGPFAKHLCEHLNGNSKQSTSSSSKFLDACRAFNDGQITESELISTTTKLGFVNVIDAFHVVNQSDVPRRFFLDERKESGGIRLTEELLGMSASRQANTMNAEIEARWRLVETAWTLGVARSITQIGHDDELSILFAQTPSRRVNVTSSRSALNGYQKGCCFYCFDSIEVVDKSEKLADVDHFFPHILKDSMPNANLDGVWNLVLSCKTCNRGTEGKFARLPTLNILERLYTRNEFLIQSHHPLRETLIAQTGASDLFRKSYLQNCYDNALQTLIHTWNPLLRAEPVF